MRIRAVTALFALLFSAVAMPSPAAAEDDWPSYGVMKHEDYKAYFKPGAFLAFMDELQITRRDVLLSSEWTELAGQPTVTETWSLLSVAENLLTESDAPYAKIASEPSSITMSWQSFRSSFSFKIEEGEPSGDFVEERVYLSHNDDLAILDADQDWGTSDEYYEAAHEQTNGECCLSAEEYDAVTYGRHSTSCSFVAHKTWEVMCISRHVGTGYRWRTFYTRLEDAIG